MKAATSAREIFVCGSALRARAGPRATGGALRPSRYRSSLGPLLGCSCRRVRWTEWLEQAKTEICGFLGQRRKRYTPQCDGLPCSSWRRGWRECPSSIWWSEWLWSVLPGPPSPHLCLSRQPPLPPHLPTFPWRTPGWGAWQSASPDSWRRLWPCARLLLPVGKSPVQSPNTTTFSNPVVEPAMFACLSATLTAPRNAYHIIYTCEDAAAVPRTINYSRNAQYNWNIWLSGVATPNFITLYAYLYVYETTACMWLYAFRLRTL